MNVKDTIAAIAEIATAAELDKLIEDGEKRLQVIKAIDDRRAVLATQAASAGTPDEEDAGEKPPTAPGAGDEEAAAAVHKGKASAPAPAAPLKRPAKYMLKYPDAKGQLGYDGTLYNRAQLKNRPEILEGLYNAGSPHVIKV